MLNPLALQPRPKFRTRILGYREDRIRLPFYIGVSSGPQHEPVYLKLPNDRSFLVSILIQGPSGSGKSITTRILLENFYMEWKRFGSNWRHPIIIFDSKTNYLGLTQPNRRPRDRYLLRTIHPDWDIYLTIPKNLIHVYLPAYVAPTDKKTVLKEMRKKWQAEGFWGVPWRHITDLAHLGTVLKVPEATLWAEDLRPTFEKCSADPNMTLKGLIGVGGALHMAAKRIRNTASRNAALSFIERWRKNRFWFSETDKLAMHLEDPFSINVLTFVETPEKVYFNQLALLIALESLMATLQESKAETQPVIVIHDILNFLGEDKPFRSQLIDAIRRLLAGQARTLAHGYVVILETQSLDLPKELGDYKKYTIHLRLKWKSQSDTLKKIPGFIGGVCIPQGYDVLTSDGVKDISMVNVGDFVYSSGSFTPVLATTSRPYKGDLIKLKVAGINVPVAATPEHPFLVIRPRKCGNYNFCRPYRHCSRCGYPLKDDWSPKWIPAEQLKIGDFLLFPVFNHTSSSSVLDIASLLEDEKVERYDGELRRICLNQFGALSHRGNSISDCITVDKLGQFAELCGYYLAEGSPDTSASLVFSFGISEHDLTEKTEALISDLFPNVSFKTQECPEKSVLRVRVYNRLLHDLFLSLFGDSAHAKHIHPCIMALPSNLLARLVYAYLKGDGCPHRRTNGIYDYSFTTVSKHLAWQIFMLLTKLGVLSTLNQGQTSSFGSKRNVYIIRVSRNYNRIFEEIIGLPAVSPNKIKRQDAIFNPPYVWMPIRSIETVKYSGTVYNIQTGNNQYVVNGVTVHNCDVHDHFNNFHKPSVVVRPPLTSYEV